MKIIKSCLTAFALFLFGLAVSTHIHANLCERGVTLGWEEWKPYQYQNADGSLAGLDIELVRAVFSHMKCHLVFEEIPWKRHLNLLEKGFVGLAAGASFIEERAKYAWFSEPVRNETVHLLVRQTNADKFEITNLADLEALKFRLGVTIGYYYGEDFKKVMTRPVFSKNVIEVTSSKQLYKMLLKDRVDGILADPVSAYAELRKTNQTGEVRNILTVFENPVYVMFSKKSIRPEFVELFNRSLHHLKSSGEFDRILDRYLRPSDQVTR